MDHGVLQSVASEQKVTEGQFVLFVQEVLNMIR